MNKFKINIYRTEHLLDVTTPSLIIQTETNELCFQSVSLRINTTVPVKINMTSTFQGSAIYTSGVGFSSSNIINEVISGMTIYQFGIESSNGETLVFNSSILFTLNDFNTGNIITSYTLSRSHSDALC